MELWNLRRRLLFVQFMAPDTLEIISDNSYTGKYFYCTCKLNGVQVPATWTITNGSEYATVNSNGRVDIVPGTVSQLITVRCDYGNSTTSKSITVSYDNQLTIECQDTIVGTTGNAIAMYNSDAVSASWSIVSGSQYATIDQLGVITILNTGTTGNVTLQAVYGGLTATRVVNVLYQADTESTTEVNEDGSITTTTTTTTTDPETGSTTETTTTQTVNEDGSTSTTNTETTTEEDGSYTSSSNTTNSDGTTSTQEVTGNSDGSSTSTTTNYNSEGDPTTQQNQSTDTEGNVDTQDIEYTSEGDPVVTGYTIDTTASGGEGKQIDDGINTEYYAFDVTRGFIVDIDFIINFRDQPPDQDENHHNILTAKRANPAPWYGFQLRHSSNYSYINLGTQFATGSNVNTRIDPVSMVNYTAEYILRIVYDPTADTNNFVCTDMRRGVDIFTATNTFPDIPELQYLTVMLGCAEDANGDPFRYSNITVQNFSITKLSAVYPPVISSNGRYIYITCQDENADIYYRLNETGNYVLYTGPITMTTDVLVEAYSELNGLRSLVVSETCLYSGLVAPTITCDGEIITLACRTPNATIYYRLDQIGSFVVYNAPIQMVADTFVETYSELGGDTSATISANCIYNPTHDYSQDYLTFEVITNGTIAWTAFGSGYTKTIYYSINGGAWTSITAATTAPTINVSAGDSVRFKGTNNTYAGSKSNYDGFEGGTASFNISGNIMSLIYGDNFVNQTTMSGTYNFCSIFKKAKVVSAENLILPSTTLTNYCYRAMFSWCTTLHIPPALPATTLAQGCYWYMFEYCAITTAPVLAATELVRECYGYMFIDCSDLNYIKCLAETGASTNQCLQGWVTRVASSGTFVKSTNAIAWTQGNNGIPTSWNVYEDGSEPEPEPEPGDGLWRYSGSVIELPYSINAIDGHSSSYAKGNFSFATTFEIASIQPTYLWFDHADQSADIYLNNTLVTTHWGGYNSFTIDISNNIILGTNRLQVVLNNTTRNTLAPAAGDFNFNATLGDVELLTGPVLPDIEYGYDGFRVNAAVTDSEALLTITTRVASSCTVTCTIDDGTYHYSDTQTGSGLITFNDTIINPHLWNGTADPHLYDITLEIYDGQTLCFTATRPFGLRYYEYVYNNTTVDPGNTYTGFTLNGSPYLLRGVCMHQDIDQKANALSETDIEADFDIIADLGCNFIRTAHYPHPRKFYDMCDEMGIIVQTEVPWVNKAQSTMSADYYTHLESQITDMVTQHYNHPSIIFWGLANEITTDDAAFAKTKIESYRTLIRTYDTSRMVGYVVSHSYPDGLGVFNNPNVDYIGQNLYVGWYIDQNTNNPSSRLNTCLINANSHNKPMALSEYGCGGTQRCHSDDPQTTTTKGNNPRHDIEYMMWLHEGHIAAIKNYPQLLFTAEWVLFDFAVASRQEGYTICLDGETTSTDESLKRLNDKGLVERDHVTKKDTYYLYKAWWNPTDKFVHICGKNYTKSTGRTIKCYTNDGDALQMYINGTLEETAAVSNNIAIFTSKNFSSGDVVQVRGDNTNDTLTFS